MISMSVIVFVKKTLKNLEKLIAADRIWNYEARKISGIF